ncbi:hypothetical protein D3C77_683790 [compost metagenome]
MRLILQFQGAVELIGIAQMLAPPLIDLRHQATANDIGVGLVVSTLEPDEGGVGIAIDHRVPLSLDQLASATHDFVPAQGDRRSQTRIEEAAATGT